MQLPMAFIRVAENIGSAQHHRQSVFENCVVIAPQAMPRALCLLHCNTRLRPKNLHCLGVTPFITPPASQRPFSPARVSAVTSTQHFAFHRSPALISSVLHRVWCRPVGLCHRMPAKLWSGTLTSIRSNLGGSS